MELIRDDNRRENKEDEDEEGLSRMSIQEAATKQPLYQITLGEKQRNSILKSHLIFPDSELIHN